AAAYLSRDLIIKTVFSQSFNEMIHLFLFQLLGDFFRIISWIFSYILLAKIKIKYFVISELVFAIFFYFSTRILLKEYGFSTISLTYLLSTVFYLGVVLLFVYKGVLTSHEND
ncbi:partial Lipid III flippase, partial [Patescibacteria group bacterium]